MGFLIWVFTCAGKFGTPEMMVTKATGPQNVSRQKERWGPGDGSDDRTRCVGTPRLGRSYIPFVLDPPLFPSDISVGAGSEDKEWKHRMLSFIHW
jgi:hypothetical protein